MSVAAEIHPGMTKGMTPRGRSRVRGGHKCHSRRDEQIARREERAEATYEATINGSKQKLRGGRVMVRLKAVTHDLVEGVSDVFAGYYDDSTDDKRAKRAKRVATEDRQQLMQEIEARRHQLENQLVRLRARLQQRRTIDRHRVILALIARKEQELYGLDVFDYAA